MKSFKDYLAETESTYNTPVVGDAFDIELSPIELVESYVESVVEDGVVIACNESVYTLLTQKGMLIENSNMPVAQDSTSPIHGGNPHDDVNKEFSEDDDLEEAEYQGRKVPLGKPMRGDVKKFKVYVKDPKTGNIKKVNFGHGGTSAKRLGQKTMKIKKSNPARRKSFRARHNCDNPGPRTKARYWSCRAW